MPILYEPTTDPASTVTLKTVWLNVAVDPMDFRSFPRMSELSVSTEQPGEVRRMANGRQRTVLRKGAARSVSLSLPYSDRDRVEWVEEHVGDLMCARDDRGRKVFGVYFSVEVSESPYDETLADLSLTFSEVTHSEAV